MTTPELLEYLLENVGGALSYERARFYLNLSQNEVLGADHPLMRAQPDPFFQTVKDSYSYIASLNCLNADSIVPGAPVGDVRSISKIYRLQPLVCGTFPSPWTKRWIRTEKVEFDDGDISVVARVAVVKSKNPLSQDCLVKWEKTNNPGTSTDEWFAETYLWPAQITSDSVPITIPEQYQTTVLLENILAKIERREYGRADYPDAQYKADLQTFREEYDAMVVQENSGFTPFKSVG